MRPAAGPTKTAILTALADGGTMTAGQIAIATGLGRPTVSATLARLVKAGGLTTVAGGYRLRQQLEPAAVDDPATETT